MLNKYLLVSTLVCGLMSVSMGQDKETIMAMHDADNQDVYNERVQLGIGAGEGLFAQSLERLQPTVGNNSMQINMQEKLNDMNIYTADDMLDYRKTQGMGVDYTDKTSFTPGKIIGDKKSILSIR